jgi:hypothetical protein
MRRPVGLVVFALLVGGCSRATPKMGHTDGGAGTSGRDAIGTEAPAESSGRVPAMHRTTTACEPRVISPDTVCVPPDGGAVGGCTRNSDCTRGLNARCAVFLAGKVCTCLFDTCQADSDCRDAGPCACNPSLSIGYMCTAGNCYVDSDCGDGGFCSPSFDPCEPRIDGYFCHTPNDTCIDDADCPGGPCAYVMTDSVWACVRPPHCL